MSTVDSGVGVGGAVGPGGGLKVGVSVANSTMLVLPAGPPAVLVIARAAAGASTVTPGGRSPRIGADAVGSAISKPGNGVNVGRGVLVAVGTAADGALPTSVSPTEQAKLTPANASALNNKAQRRGPEPRIDMLTSCW
jgi:hypothetical protein